MAPMESRQHILSPHPAFDDVEAWKYKVADGFKAVPAVSAVQPQSIRIVDSSKQSELNAKMPVLAELVVATKPELSDRWYLPILMISFLLRFLDFCSVNMVLPTLPEYLYVLGGSETDYYRCLAGNAVCTMIATTFLGAYVDGKPGRMLSAYWITGSLTVVGNVLYALAGSIPALQTPAVLLIARCIVGFGSSSAMLTMVFLQEVVPAGERQKWVVRTGILRSQGLFWGPPLGLALAALSTSEMGLWGAYTIPGWFQAAATLLATIALTVVWHEFPTSSVGAEISSSVASGPSFKEFITQGRVLMILAIVFAVGVCQCSVENVMPIVTGEALGWKGPSRGSPLTGMALMLTFGQACLCVLIHFGVQDRTFMLIGAIGFPVILASTLFMWVSVKSFGELVVIAPFMVASMLAPFAMLGSFSAFARLSLEDAPKHRGKAQALMSNLLAICNVASPAWLSLTYSGERMKEELVPRTAFLGFLAFQVLSVAALLWHYVSLRPAVADTSSKAAPLLPK